MHLPEWMTRPDAALLEVRELPRISLRALSDLRDLIAPLLLARDETRTGERDEPKDLARLLKENCFLWNTRRPC